MLLSSLPPKIALPFANNASASNVRAIPTPSQQGILQGAASFYDGFPPTCFIPTTSGGTPPFGQDFNGLLNQVTAWNRWQAAGGTVAFDGTFSQAVGGYPYGAIVQSTVTGKLWLNITDGNTTNPDANGAAGWILIYTANFNGGTSAAFANVLFKAFKTSNQALGAQTLTPVTWQTPATNAPPSFASSWDGTTITIGVAGRYRIKAMLNISVNVSGGYVEIDTHIYKNGAALRGGEMTANVGSTAWYGIAAVDTIEDLIVGDQIVIKAIAAATNFNNSQIVYQTADGSNESDTMFEIYRLS